MSFVIVTGLSGAGKSSALKTFEDAGYFCADNLPLPLVERFAMLAVSSQEYENVALGIDARSLKDEERIRQLQELLDSGQFPFQILYMDADERTLNRRYQETRRQHPLAKHERVEEGIRRERELLAPIRSRADYVIDTSRLLSRELRQQIREIFLEQSDFRSLFVTIESFGFKHGIPEDADLVFDVRFLPNPFYEPALRQKTGEDSEVRDYVMQGGVGETFEKLWFEMIDYLLPQYEKEGKTSLIIAVGCTGGHHRSVTMALHLYEHLKGSSRYGLRMEHRDMHH
ncbi:MAG: RNase adapter RapZ [Lachnospiraceae bacterium]|nr:RNase adapter RapZ [Lachnospiraceae bacterium]